MMRLKLAGTYGRGVPVEVSLMRVASDAGSGTGWRMRAVLDFIFVYIDDVLIASSSPEEHKQHLQQVFQRLSDYGILINPSTCLFGVDQLEFLGHHVSSEGIRPLDHKVEVIRKFPQPTTARQLREFVGLINFYHRFIPHCAQILQPLNALLAAARPSQRSEEATQAFAEALAHATLLSHPKPLAPHALPQMLQTPQ